MALVTITGGVSNIGLNQIMIAIKGGASTDTIVTNGRWSEQFGSLLSGIYTVQVIDTDPGTNNGIVLATGTLTIANGTSNLVTFTASPNSGAAPLSTTVYASGLSNAGVFYQLNFGDGQTASTGGFTSVQHTYSAPGTYTATLTDPQGNQLGTQTITVTSGSTSATPTADIDQNSLTTNSLTPTISGTATNLSSILLYVTQLSAGFGAQGVVDARVPVVDGAWSYSVPSSDGLTRGTYQVHVQDLTTLAGLATATLIIKQ
jgi:PKD repeat protein